MFCLTTLTETQYSFIYNKYPPLFASTEYTSLTSGLVRSYSEIINICVCIIYEYTVHKMVYTIYIYRHIFQFQGNTFIRYKTKTEKNFHFSPYVRIYISLLLSWLGNIKLSDRLANTFPSDNLHRALHYSDCVLL